MGETTLKIKIYGAQGKVREVEVTADTGATFTKIPRSLAGELGLAPYRKVKVRLGNKRVVERLLAEAEVEIEGERGIIPLTLGEEGENSLLGYTALEILGFKVNPVTGRLEKVVAIE